MRPPLPQALALRRGGASRLRTCGCRWFGRLCGLGATACARHRNGAYCVLTVFVNPLGAWCAVRMYRFPRIAGTSRHPLNFAVFPHDAATARQSVNSVVVFAQRGEVFGVCFAAVSPFLDVVYLAIVGAAQATAPGTGGLLTAGHDALLLRSNALGAVEFDGAFDAVDEHDESFFSELPLDELFARDLGTVG